MCIVGLTPCLLGRGRAAGTGKPSLTGETGKAGEGGRGSEVGDVGAWEERKLNERRFEAVTGSPNVAARGRSVGYFVCSKTSKDPKSQFKLTAFTLSSLPLLLPNKLSCLPIFP